MSSKVAGQIDGRAGRVIQRFRRAELLPFFEGSKFAIAILAPQLARFVPFRPYGFDRAWQPVDMPE